jgi:hypothetical protein
MELLADGLATGVTVVVTEFVCVEISSGILATELKWLLVKLVVVWVTTAAAVVEVM